eukprot:TRINITY_DN22534_c0_g1_i1.p1 TRINITY_DN22534_c0_g1~~TRINITY_DN22534_c0_g1_i1.p1  ORF type:complete len:523 (+),score=221.28 TRINITY_DN22534_c0_g1_i1:49-1617(+)
MFRIFNKTYEAGDPAIEKRLQRVVPLIAAQVEKIYKRKGGRALEAEEEEAVQDEVLELIKTGSLCEKDLYVLATEMKTRYTTDPHPFGRDSVVSNMSGLQRLLDGVETPSSFTPAPPSPSERHGALPYYMQRKRVLAKDTWSMVVEKDREEYLQEEEAHKRSMVEKRKAQRAALDEQIQLHKEEKAQAQQDARTEYRNIMDQVAEYEAEEKRKQEKVRAINMHLKREREKQLADRQRQRQKEREEKYAEEVRLYEEAKREEEAELQRIKQRRQDAIERVKRNAFYNQKQNALKQEEQAAAAVEDKRLAEEYAEILAKQEKARMKMLEDLAEKARKQKEAGDRIGQSMEEKAAEDERRALLATERHNQKVQEEELARLRKADHSKQTRNRFIQRQIMHLKEERERERVRGLMEKERIRQDIQNGEAVELEEKVARRMRDRKHNEEVMEQVRQRQDHVAETMSHAEKAYNRKLLTKIPAAAAGLCPQPPSQPPVAICPDPLPRDTTPFLPPSLPSSRAVSCTPY